MNMKNQHLPSALTFGRGVRDGLPIGLGYLSVSLGFGIAVVNKRLPALVALLISLLNETSAGQAAGLTIIAAGGSLVEMALTQLIINLRYSLMGLSLTQCIDHSFTLPWRMLLSFSITDEIFGVATSAAATTKQKVNVRYFSGLALLPYVGWAAGTLLGALLGQILPDVVSGALGIMLYGMFLAIIVPPACQNRGVLLAVAVAVALSCVLYYVPVFDFITSGFSVIICALLSAVLAALLFPVKDEDTEESPAPESSQ